MTGLLQVIALKVLATLRQMQKQIIHVLLQGVLVNIHSVCVFVCVCALTIQWPKHVCLYG